MTEANPRFAAARIKKLMQADDDVGRISASVPPLVSRCVELFAEELIDRAATTFMVSGESTEVEAPEKSVMAGKDPIRPHVAKPLAFAPPEPSSPQKPVRGRGQRSTLSLGWD